MQSSVPIPTSHVDGIPVKIAKPSPEPNDIQSKVKFLPQEFYTPYISVQSKARLPSPIRKYIDVAARPGIIPLFAGSPSAETFPITSMSLKVRSPDDSGQETELVIDGDALTEGLQYSTTWGIKSLLGWLYGLQELSHRRKKGEGWRISVGAGSQDLLYKAILAVLNPGDSVLVEAPMYAGIIPVFQSIDCDFVEVPTDADGILSDSLESILRGWPKDKPLPKVLYIVPYGCNPTGMTHSLERRRNVLKLAREFNIVIFEDDPYHYLYYGSSPRPPSYFELEAEQDDHPVGLVLRFDSFSKIVSAGMRLGFVSGPEALVDAMDMHTTNSNLQPSTFSQVAMFAILNHWGYDGFIKHTKGVSETYRRKRDIFEPLMVKYLTGLATWTRPEAGMFFWFKLNLPPQADGSEADSEDIVLTKGVQNGVLALPGASFYGVARNTAYVRASFSCLPESQMEEAIHRLASVLTTV